MKIISKDKLKNLSIIICLIILLIVPLVGSSYLDFLTSMALIYAIWALGYNFLLGYTGLLSFGHAAYFGLGAYTVAFLLTKFSINSFLISILAAILVSALAGMAIGFLCIRYTRIYFALLSLAFGQFFYALCFKLYHITGGSDGMHVATPYLFNINLNAIQNPIGYYYFTLFFFIIAIYAAWRIVNSPFGKILQAIRENTIRVEFIGESTRRYKWYSFILSAIYSGLAGALYAPLFGHVVPDLFHWSFGGEVLFVTLLGGYRTFIGPVVGSIVFSFSRSYITAFMIYWPLVLGSLIAIIALLFPNGIVGTIEKVFKKYFKERSEI
ncbi:MAG: branched-chain amino acid ABC transporter permease [Nitrososphaerota archaeon]